MSQIDASLNNVLPFRTKKSEPSLKEMLKDKDVQEFFQFVHENDLRLAALEAIKMKLEQLN